MIFFKSKILLACSQNSLLANTIKNDKNSPVSVQRGRGDIRLKEVVKCPYCRQRLFDLEADGNAAVHIKCQKCKKVMKIERCYEVKVT